MVYYSSKFNECRTCCTSSTITWLTSRKNACIHSGTVFSCELHTWPPYEYILYEYYIAFYGASFGFSNQHLVFFFPSPTTLPRHGADLYQGAHDPNSLLHGGFDYIERSGHDIQGTSIRMRNVTTCWLFFFFCLLLKNCHFFFFQLNSHDLFFFTRDVG